ncbi:MAG TPA: tryptophan synthase subunit alpha [Candidatus Limnocylindria bacterium]|nr:tryptophan synthase subunit alpha [Candidatus Limnocylindria bacterium]
MSLPPGARRIRDAFASAEGDGRRVLVTYLMAGHPSEEDATDAADAALRAGADILEIGVPFSDPVADGPLIAAAGHAAVAAGAGMATVLRTLRELRRRGREHPIVAMGYLNPMVAHGVERTLAELRDAGLDGLIVPDLPAGEDPRLERAIGRAGLGVTFLVTPNSTEERLERTIRASTAFLYVVPLYGVTGVRQSVAATTGPLLERIRSRVAGRVPVAVGFGVSRPEHVRELATVADGIIVGSAIVAAQNDAGAEGVASLVTDLAAASTLVPA